MRKVRCPKPYKRYKDHRLITPDDDPQSFAWEWGIYGPKDLPIPPARLDETMQEIAFRLVGCERVPLRSLGRPTKLRRAALYRHWQAGRIKFEIGIGPYIHTPILDDDGELVEEDGYNQDGTFVSATPALWEWWDGVCSLPSERAASVSKNARPDRPAMETSIRGEGTNSLVSDKEPVYKSNAVTLFGPGEQPKVNGKKKPLLTKAQYDTVRTLIEAREDGLTKDTLVKKSNHGDAVNVAKRLAKKDADWSAVLKFPGETGKRYRID